MRIIMQWVMAASLICGATMLTSFTNGNAPDSPIQADEVEAQLQKMTLREKVGQLFYVRPECLDTTIHFNLPDDVDSISDDIKAKPTVLCREQRLLMLHMA